MLQHLLSTEIQLVDKISANEAMHLVKQLEASELALEKFLKNEISFSVYCEILELCDIDIDDYLINLEENLLDFGVAV